MTKRLALKSILALLLTLNLLNEIATTAHAQEYFKPYTPTRLDWAELYLNASCDVRGTKINASFKGKANGAIVLMLFYSKEQDIPSYDFEFVELTAKECVKTLRLDPQFQWVKLEVSRKAIEDRRDR